jgi:hypothetical protein
MDLETGAPWVAVLLGEAKQQAARGGGETLAQTRMLCVSKRATRAAAHQGNCDRTQRRARAPRPEPSVCGLGSARLLLSSRRRRPGYRNGDIAIAPTQVLPRRGSPSSSPRCEHQSPGLRVPCPRRLAGLSIGPLRSLCVHAIAAAGRVAVRAAAFDSLREPGRRRRAYGFDPIVSDEPASTRLLLLAMSGAPKH